MKCFVHHSVDAVAVCAYCGKALCAECAKQEGSLRMACSNECATALTREESAMKLLLEKSSQSLKANALYCYLSGGLSAAAAVGAWFMLPSPFLIYFTGACAVVLIASGAWYSFSARRQGM
jgi:hypothetical protein